MRAQLPVQLFVTLWNAAHQAPLYMGSSRQEYWSGLPFPPPGDIPDTGIKVCCVSCIGKWILHHCATWEALLVPYALDHTLGQYDT